MMCAKYGNLSEEIKILEYCGSDRFHLDVMDGNYVNNFGMGMQDINYICKNASIPTEIHLMIEKPGRHIQKFIECGADIIYIHPESDYHPITVLEEIKNAGAEGGIVINPGTSVESILELLNVAKHVLVMGVNPGQAGQIYLPYAENKIDKLLKLQKQFDFIIGMDGACNLERIQCLSQKGVSQFVLGTAALFNNSFSYKEMFEQLNKIKNKVQQ